MPPRQVLHADKDVADEYVPGAQPLHDEEPVFAWNVPRPQLVHVDAPSSLKVLTAQPTQLTVATEPA